MTNYPSMTTAERDRLDRIFDRLVRANAPDGRFTITAFETATEDAATLSGDRELVCELAAQYTAQYTPADLVGTCLDPDHSCGECWQCAETIAEQNAAHIRAGCDDCGSYGYRTDVLAPDHYGRDDAVTRQCASGAAPCPAHRCYRAPTTDSRYPGGE